MKKWNFLLGLILEKQELAHNNFKTFNNTHKQWKEKCAKKNIENKTHKIMTSNEKNRNLFGWASTKWTFLLSYICRTVK
jgi:hypothetical protein